ncbi:MAG: hypothetical protein IJQ58_09660 [Synergistaceae bacterium]|nr:hypothetical protein [Synergistaceae bacterium]
MRKGICVLAFAVMAVMSWPGASWPSSFYVIKGSGNEGIKYYRDRSGGYSQDKWGSAETSSTLSNLINGSSDGDNVYVQRGVYLLDQSITIARAIKLYGGFSGTEASSRDRDISANPSVLSGQNTKRVFFVNGGNALIDGFTIKDGKAMKNGAIDIGSGIYVKSGNPEITNCTIYGNNASNGGGIYVSEGDTIIRDSIITGNEATSGGGIYIYGGSLTAINCAVNGNSSTQNGGGILVNSNAIMTVTSTTIAGNSATNYGGGIYSGGGNIELTSCTITSNTTKRGGGIYVNAGNTSIASSTIISNTASDSGHEIYSKGTINLSASIIFNSEATNSIYNSGNASAILTACALPEGLSLISATGNISLPASWNPVMLEATSYGVTHTTYRPESSSELSLLRADESSYSLLPETDQLGNTRTKHTLGAIDSLWDGNGSEGTPYIISTPEGLNLLASLVNAVRDYDGEYFCLSCDIEYTTENYAAIGGESHEFNGIFDGRGHAVKGINLGAGNEDYCGIFGHVGESGIVKDIALRNVHITGKNHAGCIAGLNEGTITRCRVYDDVAITAQENDSSNHGGIAGTNTGKIESCVCGAELTAQEGLTGCENFGGIAGNNTGTITGCLYLGGTTE